MNRFARFMGILKGVLIVLLILVPLAACADELAPGKSGSDATSSSAVENPIQTPSPPPVEVSPPPVEVSPPPLEPTDENLSDFTVSLIERGCEITNNFTGQKAEFVLGMDQDLCLDALVELSLGYEGVPSEVYLDIDILFGFEDSGDPYYVNYIKFFRTEPSTARGLRVGDPVSKMLELYGCDYEIDEYRDTIYYYYVDDMHYTFNYNHGLEKKDALRTWAMGMDS